MRWFCLGLLLAGMQGLHLQAQQTACASVPTFSSCDLVYELTAEELSAHRNPYTDVQLQAEFNTPKHRTLLIPGFWDGGRKMVIRFTPTLDGDWQFRITSNIARWNDQTGTVTAPASEQPGFVEAANVHHWMTIGNRKPHLWLGGQVNTLRSGLDDPAIAALTQAKCNHVQGLAVEYNAFTEPDRPDSAYFEQLDARVKAANQKGLVVDLVLGATPNSVQKQFPTPDQRERFVRYMAARYSAFNITWLGLQSFERENGRGLLKEMGTLLKKHDAYLHPRATGADATSSPLLGDGWLTFVNYGSNSIDLGAVEHQLYPLPGVNSTRVSGDANERRHALWNATMNGQYIGLADLRDPKPFALWHDFFEDTRFWELEPYFDVDGGRAVALIRDFGEEDREAVEYIIYVEKPGPVEVSVIRHNYDVEWYDPVSGETQPAKKYKGEHFTGEPPNRDHDWVLHISREGRKQRMQSYKFESKPTLMQEWEPNSPKTPFTIAAPSGEELSVKKPQAFEAKLTRPSRSTRTMLYLWTGDATVDGEGTRVLGTGPQGQFTIPPNIVRTPNGVLNLRVTALSATGKLWGLDKVFRLVP